MCENVSILQENCWQLAPAIIFPGKADAEAGKHRSSSSAQGASVMYSLLDSPS